MNRIEQKYLKMYDQIALTGNPAEQKSHPAVDLVIKPHFTHIHIDRCQTKWSLYLKGM